jgi:hypothetical protein
VLYQLSYAPKFFKLRSCASFFKKMELIKNKIATRLPFKKRGRSLYKKKAKLFFKVLFLQRLSNASKALPLEAFVKKS